MYYPINYGAFWLLLQSGDSVSVLVDLIKSKVFLAISALIVAVVGSIKFRTEAINLASALLSRITRELTTETAGPDKNRSVKDVLIDSKEAAMANSSMLEELKHSVSKDSSRLTRIEAWQQEISQAIELHRHTAEDGLKGLRSNVDEIQKVCTSTQQSVSEVSNAVNKLSNTLLEDALANRRKRD